MIAINQTYPVSEKVEKKWTSSPWILLTAISSLFLFSFVHRTYSQEIDFNKLDHPDKGNFNFVTGIAQAPNGIMWFSTKNGLFSYDGNSISQFNPNPVNPNSLSSNALESIAVDSEGSIWTGMLGYGLDKFNPETGKFTHYRFDPENPAGLSNDTVTKIITDSQGTLWIGTHGGLDKYMPDLDEFEHFRHDPNDTSSLSCDQVRVLFLDRDEVLWVGTGSPYSDNGGGPEDGGLNRMNMETGKFTRFLHDPGDTIGLMNNKISAIYEDRAGNMWIGTGQNSLHILNKKTGKISRQKYMPMDPGKISGPEITAGTPGHFHITFITEDVEGNFWIGTSSTGVLCFPASDNKRLQFPQDGNFASGFTDGGAWSAFTSRDGVFWMGSTGANIYRINLFRKKIAHFTSSRPVRDFCLTISGDLWIATDTNIIIKEDRNEEAIRTEIDISPNDEADDFVQKITEDREGKIWIGGNNGLSLWDEKNNKLVSFKHERGNRASLGNNQVITINEDRKGNLWIGTVHGLSLMDQKRGTFQTFYVNKADTVNVGINIITSILPGQGNNLWVGTWNNGGVHLFDPTKNTSKSYLNGSSIICLFEDSFGTLWAGTLNGLFRYIPKTDGFERYIDLSTMNSFFEVNEILEDDQQHLWVCANEALLRINPQRDEVNRLRKSYGIENFDFNWNAGYKDREGNLYFGHQTGYLFFDPKEIMTGSKPPEIAFISFQLANQLVSKGDQILEGKDILEEEGIRLQSDQNVFIIDYAVIDYNNPEENQLLCYLENFDNSWQKASSDGKSFYFNVAPGKYAFRVKAMNSYGLWAEKKINITILPPWWRTWWAYGVYALLFGLMVFAFDRFQRRRIQTNERQKTLKRELEQAKEIEKAYTELKATQNQLIQAEKMASLGELTAGIAHEIQNPLNFVNNFSDVNAELIQELEEEVDKGDLEEIRSIAKDIASNEQKIIHHGKRADAIVKNMLQHSRGGGDEKTPTDINALADEYLRLSYHGLRAKDKSFNADFQTDLDLDLPKIKVIPQDIGRVLLNIFNNAFYAVGKQSAKDTGTYKPLVVLKTEQKNDKVVISVKDNGPGIPDDIREKIFQPFFTTKAAGEGTGLGLSLSYDIITKGHGGTLEVETKEGKGTTFRMIIPKQ